MQKEKILIVNSSEDIRNSLKDILSKENYEVHTALLVNEALETVKDISFSVVLTEVEMPDMKGIEILHKFKDLRSNVSIIVVTNSQSVSLAVEAMKKGAYDYITKPFNLEEVKFIIDRALERGHLLEEAKEKQIYQELALLDSLTGVYNRRYFEELIRREINRGKRYKEIFSVLIIDIDDFKRYNDTYGHLSGDEILKKLAGLLIKNSRCTDFVFRYGGDEFAILTPNTDKKGGSILGYRLLKAAENIDICLQNNVKERITLSIGLATFPDDANDQEDLVRRADKALYEAKQTGKNRLCLFGLS